MPRIPKSETIQLRIIAGDLRSRKIQFECDPRTRPMKDRTREAVMNLLGGTFSDTYAFDLFGGSGILAFEAISRGARRAVVWEILKPRASDILRFSKELGVADQVTVLATDVMRWTCDGGGLASPDWACFSDAPWILFACPPYRLWDNQGEAIRDTLEKWLAASPDGSLFAVEMEMETDENWLPRGYSWDVRRYAPAKMAVAEKSSASLSPQDPLP
jgi:16S rRNA (guanine966-N2)-methyltransferase